MEHTPSLPTELWQDIASHLQQSDQLSLILLNRSFHAICRPALYRSLIIRGPDVQIGETFARLTQGESPSKFTLSGPSASQLLQRLESSAELRSWVQHCKITNFRSEIAWISWNADEDQMATIFREFQRLMNDIFKLVGSFPSLKSVKLLTATIPSDALYYLCCRPYLSLAIIVEGVAFFGTDEVGSGMRLTASRFKSEVSQLQHAMHSLTKLTLGCNLRELALGTEANRLLGRFYQAHIDYPGVSLPQLEVLAIGWIIPDCLPFFKSTPNLVELRLRGSTRMQLGNAPLDSAWIPKLQRFYGHNCFLPVFTAGRPIHTIDTRSSTGSASPFFLGQDDNINLMDLGARFGSSVDVRVVTWDNCNQNRKLLLYLVMCNPKITCLELTPTLGYTAEELRERLEILKELKELRTLYVRCLKHVPCEATLSWESRQCEYLQSEASRFLMSISFSVLIDWNREEGTTVWLPSGSGMEVYDMAKAGAILVNHLMAS